MTCLNDAMRRPSAHLSREERQVVKLWTFGYLMGEAKIDPSVEEVFVRWGMRVVEGFEASQAQRNA